MEKIKTETRNACCECGSRLVGRSDKKFCCDQCRSAYFNKQNSDHNHYIRRINQLLRKNRRILQELSQLGIVNVSAAYLHQRGFSFDYFTHELKKPAENEHRYCYEYGYYKTGTEQICLVKFPETQVKNTT